MMMTLAVVLVKYSIEGKPYTIMKRSTKRSIFLQVLLFSANGIYTTFADKTMKLMVFATGNIYKSTGSGFEHIDGSNNGRLLWEDVGAKWYWEKKRF